MGMTQTSTVAEAKAHFAHQGTVLAQIAGLGGIAAIGRGDLIRISRSLGAVPQVRTSDAAMRRYIEWALA